MQGSTMSTNNADWDARWEVRRVAPIDDSTSTVSGLSEASFEADIPSSFSVRGRCSGCSADSQTFPNRIDPLYRHPFPQPETSSRLQILLGLNDSDSLDLSLSSNEATFDADDLSSANETDFDLFLANMPTTSSDSIVSTPYTEDGEELNCELEGVLGLFSKLFSRFRQSSKYKPYLLSPPSTQEQKGVFSWLEPTMTCPVTGDIMTDPVVDIDGYSYERAAILKWIAKDGRSPITRKRLAVEDLRPNRALKTVIERYLRSKEQ